MIHNTFDGLTNTASSICIVGAGPVGISLATELDRFGYSVLLLESGRNSANAYVQDLSNADIVSREIHDDMSIAVSRQLGGSSNLWGGLCVRYDPVDFVPRPGLVDARWPMTYKDLLPYYDRACIHTRSGEPIFELPIAGIATDDDAFSLHTLERAANKQKSQDIHRKTLAASPKIDVRTQCHGSRTRLWLRRPCQFNRYRAPRRFSEDTCSGSQSCDCSGWFRKYATASCRAARRAQSIRRQRWASRSILHGTRDRRHSRNRIF